MSITASGMSTSGSAIFVDVALLGGLRRKRDWEWIERGER